MIKNIGLAICGCFCAHQNVLTEIENLVKKGYNIFPILSENSKNIDTRFGSAKELKDSLAKITNNTILDSIEGVEPTGPNGKFDIVLVAPCSGNTLAKLANGINDTPVTMAVKSHLRNNKPVVIALTTNDGLGASFKNIASLLNTKNIYIVPFGQDNYEQKPKSLACDWSLIEKTMLDAEKHIQTQPILLS